MAITWEIQGAQHTVRFSLQKLALQKQKIKSKVLHVDYQEPQEHTAFVIQFKSIIRVEPLDLVPSCECLEALLDSLQFPG